MYRVHDWAEVHRLFHREGWTKTRIAGKWEMSRNTAARLLELSEPPLWERLRASRRLRHRSRRQAARVLGRTGIEPSKC
jgi:hypothetical protein